MYRTADGQTSIDVKLEDETVWLSANQMANLLFFYSLDVIISMGYRVKSWIKTDKY